MQAFGTPFADARPDTAQVDELVRRSGSSFFWAMRLLPLERRRAMFAVYAFCRAVDDVADAEWPAAMKQRELDRWRTAIDLLYAGRPDLPITRALLPAVERFGLSRGDFEAVIDGMAMDAEAPILAPDRATLVLYCDRVAGAVGRLSVRVFGVTDAYGMAVAGHLGQALQLTNILRDLDEDAARGRLYLPSESLSMHGVPLKSPSSAIAHPGIDAVCRDIAAWAEQAFAGAAAAMARCDPLSVRPARIMMRVYRCSFDRLCARGWRPPRRNVAPGKLVKLVIALRACVDTAP